MTKIEHRPIHIKFLPIVPKLSFVNQVSQMEGQPCTMWSRYLVTDHAALRNAFSAESEQCMKRKTAKIGHLRGIRPS